MPECTNLDLKNARMRRKLLPWQIGEQLGVSESTVRRWENGDVEPGPDDIDRFAEAVADPMLWYRWMRSHYDSFRKRSAELATMTMPNSIARSKYELEDILPLLEQLHRDALDGRIDNPQLKEKCIQEAKEAYAALGDMLQQLGANENHAGREVYP